MAGHRRLCTIKELAKKFHVSIPTLRTYQGKKIIGCHGMHSDGKTQLFDVECVAVRMILKDEIRVRDPGQTLPAIGRILCRLCGTDDKRLLRMLAKERRADVVRKLLKNSMEMIGLE